MLRADETKERSELRRRLVCWRESVELYTRGLRDDPRKYAALHADLLHCCRALAAGCAEEHQTFYEDMVKMVQPWLNTEALVQARQGILIEVLQRCCQAESALGRRSWGEATRRWLRPALMSLAGVAGLAVLGWAAVRWWLLLRTTFKSARLQISMALERLGIAERWMLGGVLAVLIAMFLLSRTAKS